MLYLLLTADSFEESALKELKGSGKFRIVDQMRNIFVADMVPKKSVDLRKLKFTYAAFPIRCKGAIDKKNYVKSIYRQLMKLKLGKKDGLKLECYDINCRNGYSAKDIEVALGGMLEKDGFNVNIATPKVLGYAILLNDVCYCGYVAVPEGARIFIDPFRVYKEKLVSRAEFKIAEAFDAFNPPIPKVALDIGAAPGGWSLMLAMKGATVIAVDKAELDDVAMKKAGVKLVEVTKRQDLKKLILDSQGRTIFHIKRMAEDADLSRIKVDMLANDVNKGSKDSSKIVKDFAGLLDKDGTLIMTVKCVRRNVMTYVGEAKAKLKKDFRIIGWKVLPHNRQEITLYARKR